MKSMDLIISQTQSQIQSQMKKKTIDPGKNTKHFLINLNDFFDKNL